MKVGLYQALAEALAEPPPWLALAGREWPLTDLTTQLLPGSPAVTALARVPAEPLAERRARYAALFGPAAGPPRFWLYESAFLDGRVVGEATFAVAKCYAAAGLEVDGGELADHAALELAFLAYLVDQDDRLPYRRFLDEHALRWLPALGRGLAAAGDPIYAPIGQLLAEALDRFGVAEPGRLQPSIRNLRPAARAARLPALAAPDSCTLCGFCVQSCPVAALTIAETATHTALLLLAGRCTGCGRCVRTCEAWARDLPSDPLPGRSPAPPAPFPTREGGDGAPLLSGAGSEERSYPVGEGGRGGEVVLRLSERVVCRKCGAAMVSRAELDYVIKQIGHPAWLDYCPACRAAL